MSPKIDWKTGGNLAAMLVIGALALSLIVFIIWRIAWVTNVEQHEFAFSFDRWSGKIEVIKEKGWVSRTPIVYKVHTIDLRPYQISITANIQKNASSGTSMETGSTIGARVLNAKLVRFNPDGLNTFVEWHGRDAADNLRDMLEILKAYAFDKDEGRGCPFLTVTGDSTPKETKLAVK